MTTTYWCEYAWLGNDQVAAGVLLTIAGDRLVGVESDIAVQPAGSIRLAGLTVPGFANAHSHAFHRVLRGHTQVGQGSFWTWREQMYSATERLNPDTYHALARGVFAEMACAGMTSVGEFHYLHHDKGGAAYSVYGSRCSTPATSTAESVST
jgi:cytosine/adenosine deaminase-related metal-dependent hydrolase